jgi:hypothetical protein
LKPAPEASSSAGGIRTMCPVGFVTYVSGYSQWVIPMVV